MCIFTSRSAIILVKPPNPNLENPEYPYPHPISRKANKISMKPASDIRSKTKETD
jgi:hypothetical protein